MSVVEGFMIKVFDYAQTDNNKEKFPVTETSF